MRGLISALLLTALEKELQKASGKKDLRLAECFDLIAGTSTGGVLALLLTTPDLNDPRRPRYSASAAFDMFHTYLPLIFRNIRNKGGQGLFGEKYDGRSLLMHIRMACGNTRMSQLVCPCLITSYDLKLQQATFFCSHDHFDADTCARFNLIAEEHGKPDWYVRDISRATSAAPVFFDPASIRPADSPEGGPESPAQEFLDGGLFANNPSICAYAEVREKWVGNMGIKDMMTVSVGTGESAQDIRPGGYLSGWGGGLGLINLLLGAATESTHFAMQRIYSTALMDNYYRFNWPLGDDIPLDAASEQNMERLLIIATEKDQPPQRSKYKTWSEMGSRTANYLPPAIQRELREVAAKLLRQDRA